MATANFKELQHDLPFYVLDTSELDEYEIEFIVRLVCDELDALNQELDLFMVELKPGYYTGYQLYARACLDGFDYSEDELKEFTDDDAPFYTWTYMTCETAQELMKLYEKERELISQRFETIAADYGLLHIRCVGRFSNGEALYEEVKKHV